MQLWAIEKYFSQSHKKSHLELPSPPPVCVAKIISAMCFSIESCSWIPWRPPRRSPSCTSLSSPLCGSSWCRSTPTVPATGGRNNHSSRSSSLATSLSGACHAGSSWVGEELSLIQGWPKKDSKRITSRLPFHTSSACPWPSLWGGLLRWLRPRRTSWSAPRCTAMWWCFLLPCCCV